MSNSLKRTFATVLAMVLIVGFLPLKALVRADVSEVYYIYTEDGSSEKKVGTELPSGAEKVCVYVAGGTYDLQEDDENVWVSGGTVNASFDEVWNNYGKFKLAGTGKVVTDGITLKTNENIRPAYDGEINYEDLYDYFYNHGWHYVTEFTSDFVYSTEEVNTFDEIVIPEGVTLTIAPYEDENGDLNGTTLIALFMSVYGTLNIEGVSEGMIGLNTLIVGDHAGAEVKPGGKVTGGPGACIDLSDPANSFANLPVYRYDDNNNIVEIPSDEAERLIYDTIEEKWIESNMLDAVGFYRARYGIFVEDENNLWSGDKPVFSYKYYSYSEDEELEFTVEVPSAREGIIPKITIISNNGCKSEKPELTANGNIYTFTYVPNDLKGFTIDIDWSEFDSVYSDDDYFVLEIDSDRKIGYDVEPYYEIFTDPGDGYHKKVRIDKDDLTAGVVVSITPEQGYDLRSFDFGWQEYSVENALSNFDGFSKTANGYELVLNNDNVNGEPTWLSLFFYGEFQHNVSLPENVYYIYEYSEIQAGSQIGIGKEIPADAYELGKYVDGGTYKVSKYDSVILANNANVYATVNQVMGYDIKLSGTGKVVTNCFTVTSDLDSYEGNLNGEAIYDYFYSNVYTTTTEITSDWCLDFTCYYDFDNLVIDEGVTLYLCTYKSKDYLSGSELSVNSIVVNGTLDIEGLSNGMTSQNTLIVKGDGSLSVGDNGVIAGYDGSCINPYYGSVFHNFDTYRFNEYGFNLIPYDKPQKVKFDSVSGKWMLAQNEDANYYFKATYDSFESGKLILLNGNKIGSDEYWSYEADEEMEFSITLPKERAGCTPQVKIVEYGVFYNYPVLTTEDGNVFTFSFTPEYMEGFHIYITWSEFDVVVLHGGEEFIIDLELFGSLDYEVSHEGTVYEEPNKPTHMKMIYDLDILDEGLTYVITPGEDHYISDIYIGEGHYSSDMIENIDGFSLDGNVLTITYNADNLPYDWMYLKIYADDADNSQETETGTLLVNYVPTWDCDFNPLAYVEIDGELVESETGFEFVPGEELTFTIHAPEDREGVERCVQIFSDDGEYYTSNLPFGSGNNLEVVNDQFTFTPPDNKNYIVIVDWSEYDYYRGEKNLLLIETEDCGNGQTRVDKEDFNIVNPGNENYYKHIVPSFNLSEENPARVYFDAGKDVELTVVNLQINDEPMVTYVPEWSEWYADANLMSEDPHFELINGTWTYKITEPNNEKCVYKFIVDYVVPEKPETGNITVNSGDINVQYAFVKDGVQGNFIDLDDKLVLESEDAADKIVLKFLPSAGQTLPSLRIQRTIMGAIMNPQIVQVNSDNTVVLEKGDYYWGTWTVDFADGSKILPYEFMIKAVGSEDYDPLADYKKDVIYGYAEDYVIELDFGDETPYMVVVYPNWGDAITLEAQSDGKYYYAPYMLEGFLIKVYEDYDAYEFDSVCAGEGETEFMFNMFFEGYPENTIPSSKISMLSPLKNTAFSEDGSKVKVVVSDDLDAFSWKITLGDEAFNYVVMLNGRDITGQVVSNDGILTVEKSVFEDDMDLSITVNYRKTFEITSEYNEGGSVSVPATAKEGKTVTVNATAFDGYVVDSIKVNNEVISGNEFVMPSENVKVEVVFRRLQYTVTLNEVFNGTASVSATSAKPGDEIVITYAPAEGYELDEVNVVGAELVGNKFTMPAADVIVTITFKKADYSVSLSQGIKNCEATLSKTTANYGDEITVDIVPAEGYKVLGIKVNGAAINDTKFTMPAEDVTVDVILQKIDYRISVSDTVGGTVSVAETSNYGDEITITVTPDEGYELDTLKVNGETISGNKFTMPAADVTVEVTFKKTETVKNGWVLENGVYYFYKNGELAKGWIKDGNSWYYMDQSNGAMITGWKQIGGVWYYFASSGAMITGWRQIGGAWYYFDNSGAMATGWKSVGGKWYYFNNGGAMVTGWKSIGGVWYFFGSSGAMTTGWAASGGKWYYFASSGAMVTGWIELGGKWYYLKSDGSMASDEYCGGYYLNEDGTWTKTAKADWKKDSVGWYYQDTTGWYAKNEKIKIDGKVYDFNAAGYCTNP